MRARALLRRWSCFWHWPVGHAYELIDYVDPLSGRWAARARCVACGHETGLAVGDQRSGVHFTNNPLASMLTNQGTFRTVPASAKIGAGPPSSAASGLVVTAPDGGRIAVRYVQVRFYLGLRRSVYCAWRVGRENATVVAPEFDLAVAGAAGVNPSDPWVERLTRELATEFVPVA